MRRVEFLPALVGRCPIVYRAGGLAALRATWRAGTPCSSSSNMRPDSALPHSAVEAAGCVIPGRGPRRRTLSCSRVSAMHRRGGAAVWRRRRHPGDGGVTNFSAIRDHRRTSPRLPRGWSSTPAIPPAVACAAGEIAATPALSSADAAPLATCTRTHSSDASALRMRSSTSTRRAAHFLAITDPRTLNWVEPATSARCRCAQPVLLGHEVNFDPIAQHVGMYRRPETLWVEAPAR